MRKTPWKRIGSCPVDAGLLMLVDPCYVLPSKGETPEYTYDDLLKELDLDNDNPTADQITFKDIAGDGVVVETGWGDGYYPVYIKKIGDRIAEVKVVFIEGGDR